MLKGDFLFLGRAQIGGAGKNPDLFMSSLFTIPDRVLHGAVSCETNAVHRRIRVRTVGDDSGKVKGQFFLNFIGTVAQADQNNSIHNTAAQSMKRIPLAFRFK